jgi:predicted MFS family arabinose efflux permease
VSQGAIATAQGIGASLSNMVAGFIIVWVGYSAAFLFLGCVAAAAFILYWFAMPETRKPVSEWRKSVEGLPEEPQQQRVSVVAAGGPCL